MASTPFCSNSLTICLGDGLHSVLGSPWRTKFVYRSLASPPFSPGNGPLMSPISSTDSLSENTNFGDKYTHMWNFPEFLKIKMHFQSIVLCFFFSNSETSKTFSTLFHVQHELSQFVSSVRHSSSHPAHFYFCPVVFVFGRHLRAHSELSSHISFFS